MKKQASFIVAALAVAGAAAIGQQKKRTEPHPGATASLQLTQCALKVNGMDCGGCAQMVKQGLLKLEGVNAATVDYNTGVAKIDFNTKKTSPEKIAADFNRAYRGFRIVGQADKTTV